MFTARVLRITLILFCLLFGLIVPEPFILTVGASIGLLFHLIGIYIRDHHPTWHWRRIRSICFMTAASIPGVYVAYVENGSMPWTNYWTCDYSMLQKPFTTATAWFVTVAISDVFTDAILPTPADLPSVMWWIHHNVVALNIDMGAKGGGNVAGWMNLGAWVCPASVVWYVFYMIYPHIENHAHKRRYYNIGLAAVIAFWVFIVGFRGITQTWQVLAITYRMCDYDPTYFPILSVGCLGWIYLSWDLCRYSTQTLIRYCTRDYKKAYKERLERERLGIKEKVVLY